MDDNNYHISGEQTTTNLGNDRPLLAWSGRAGRGAQSPAGYGGDVSPRGVPWKPNYLGTSFGLRPRGEDQQQSSSSDRPSKLTTVNSMLRITPYENKDGYKKRAVLLSCKARRKG